ncbi:MAG: hypothetical protein NVSMB32_09150 [Actinomycetota bacterium]
MSDHPNYLKPWEHLALVPDGRPRNSVWGAVDLGAGATPRVRLGIGEVWAVASSDGKTPYIVAAMENAAWACSCPSGSRGNRCRHIKVIAKELARREPS